MEKAAQICAAVQEQECYSKHPSVFLLTGGNMRGKHVRTPVPVNLLQICPVPGLITPLIPELCPCSVQMSSEALFIFPTACWGEYTFLWAESWRAAGSQDPASRGEVRAPVQQGRGDETRLGFSCAVTTLVGVLCKP